MPKGIMLTPEQQAARREEIIGVALQLIAEHGFQKTSMREIADLANMGKSSLYDFFKTKDDLMVRLLIYSMLSIIYTSRPSASPEKMLDETMNIFLHRMMNAGGEG